MKQKSGSLSIAILCSCAIIAKHLVIGPEYMIKATGNAAWLEITGKCLLSGIVLFVIIWLYKPLFPCSPEELFKSSLGVVGKTVLSYVYAFGFILLNAGLLRILVDALNSVMAANAPREFFALFVITAVLFASFCGLRASGNLCTVIFPFVVLTLVGVCIILLPHYRFENIMPVLGKGADALVDSVFTKQFVFPELVLLLFLSSKLGSFKELKKAGMLTVLFVSVFSIFFTLVYCLAIPYPASERFFLPLYQMTRLIKAGTFLQRLEPLAVFIWTSCIMCSMSILTAVSASLLSGDHRTRQNGFVPIVISISLFLAMLSSNEVLQIDLYEKLLDYCFILYPVIPFAVILISRLRKGGATSR